MDPEFEQTLLNGLHDELMALLYDAHRNPESYPEVALELDPNLYESIMFEKAQAIINHLNLDDLSLTMDDLNSYYAPSLMREIIRDADEDLGFTIGFDSITTLIQPLNKVCSEVHQDRKS